MSAPGSSPAPPAFPALPELRTTQVFGRTIRYYDIGSGPPVLLIHGIGGDADEWAFCFQPLSSSHRVIALDLLGFGRSDKPLISYSIAGFVEVVERFLRGLRIERCTLTGNSLGGWIAASFALRFPQAVDKLVLVDAAGVWDDATEFPIDLRVSTRSHLRGIFQMLFYNKSLATEELIDLAYQQHLERGDGYTIDSVLKNLHGGRERLDDTIASLTTPTLIVWGENDEIIPVENGRRMHRLIANSQLTIIPQCGHLPALERPTEFVPAVLEFLAR